MYILLAAATSFEIQPTIDALGLPPTGTGPETALHIRPLITGVGAINTTWSIMKQIDCDRPALIIQAGIAGCLTDRPAGEVLAVGEDQFSDQGVWEEGRFKSIFDMKLADGDTFPFTGGRMVNPHRQLLALTGLSPVGALTVNEITTNPERISWYQQNTTAIVESMEGGALHYVALQEAVPFLQLRSVSNAVGVRDKTKWNIKLAIARLNEVLISLLDNPALKKEIANTAQI
jgi:futalosine hydrolase